MRWMMLPLWLLAGCQKPEPPQDTGGLLWDDADGDGYDERYDCDDGDPSVHPGAPEVCGGIDEDCDGFVDDADPDRVGESAWYVDQDGDGFGDPAVSVRACEPPSGTVGNDTDCDDGDAEVHPEAAEVCDGLDQDCDGEVDEEAADAGTWYADGDGDGWGDFGAVARACEQPTGTVAEAGDCDDANAGVHPGAQEVCDGLDQDCDGEVDEESVDAATWYADSDGDGYGDATLPVDACAQPTGAVADATDCDDGDAGTNPGALEICDGVDQDCDGEVDEDALDLGAWYADADGDGYGDPAASMMGCTPPAGTVADATDCDDGEAGVNPAAMEVCDGVDQDCDGAVDEGAVDAGTWYADVDGDGWGDAGAAVAACAQPTGTVADATDCDDGEAGVNPGATETCDGVDQDCDGAVDEGAVDAGTWYTDADGDGWGDPGVSETDCTQPTGTVSGTGPSATDCDDGDAGVNPGAMETCDGVDQDCDGVVDEEASDAATWYADLDGDGWGDPGAAVSACSQPSGTVSDATDCDDADPAVFPGATETCDGADQDCDGVVDEGAVDMDTWYADADGDGFGDAAVTTLACACPSGAVADATDCDDGDAGVHPGASEICDGVDQDCDGDVDEDAEDAGTWYADLDGDGWGDPGAAVTACTQPTGTVADASDCDDGDAAIYPGGTEYCDGVDTDCDGDPDPTATVTFLDASGGKRDVSAEFTSSSSTSPWAFSADGTLAFCAGSYRRTISVSAASAAILGLDGAALTTLSGGGLGSVILAVSGAADLEVSGLTLTQGAATHGGGISSAISGLDFVAEDLVVTYSAATSEGGGLYFDSAGSVTLDQVEIWYCGAPKGAGLFMDHGDLIFDDLTVEYCTATSQGGGLYLKHLDAIGSGLIASYDYAASKGAGLYVEDAALDLTDSVVSHNLCLDKGGGLNVKTNATLALTRTLVADNQAVSGGGLYLESAAGSCAGTATSSSYEGFVRNLATRGGALYVKGSSATWTATTCDMGTGLDENALYDAWVETGALGYSWGDDVDFSCTASVCR